MRILIATLRFPTGPGQSYLTTELADALGANGHDVEVLHLDWEASSGSKTEKFRRENGQRVVRCAPHWLTGAGSLVKHSSKFVLSGRHAARVARAAFDLESFDTIIMWMPALAFGDLVRDAERAGIVNRHLIVWDFFPDHYHEVGRIPSGPAYRISRLWEQALLKHFTAIFCTLPDNAEYLRRRFRIGESQEVRVAPVWGDITPFPAVERAEIRRRHHLPASDPIAVFGGQLVEGRGFGLLLGAAARSEAAGSRLRFLFVGDGSHTKKIRECEAGSGNVIYRPAMPRSTYLELLGACDVGMVATVPGVTSFSFPSKTIDYLRAGLPVAAAVEAGSGYVELLKRYRVGDCVRFGDADGFSRLVDRLASDPVLRAAARSRAQRCLTEVFDVSHAVSALTRAKR